ncbi:MAG: peptidase U32 [Deltaproteobacteria bacterium]|nr:MAG: peptidase U32 [Deltaproteobacteria bacterium]
MKIPELLAPAGNLEKLVTAVHYGADAVYLGGKSFSLRARAGNFSRQEMAQGIEHAHRHGVKVYVTVNIFAHNRDFDGLEDYLAGLAELGADGLIVSDPGILAKVKEAATGLPVHLSTQANVTNSYSANFWHSQGIARINLARELSLEEIKAIRQAVDAELEVFVHGALCISYSGRCMLSNYLTGRDANQGKCSHPCRFSYALMEEKRPGEYFPVEEDERGTYIFNAKDLCLLPVLPLLVHAGIDSLKIEGRMKSVFYAGGVVRAYRAALDYLKSLPEKDWNQPEKIVMPRRFLSELEKLGTRGASRNFFFNQPQGADMLYKTSRARQFMEPVAIIRKPGVRTLAEIRNTLFLGEKMTLMEPKMKNQDLLIKKMYNQKGEAVKKANPGNMIFFETEPAMEKPSSCSILIRKNEA